MDMSALEQFERSAVLPGVMIEPIYLTGVPADVSRLLESNESISIRFDVSTRTANGRRRTAREVLDDAARTCQAIRHLMEVFGK